MKKLIIFPFVLLFLGSVFAQTPEAQVTKLAKLAEEMAIHATDIYHTQWPSDTVRPYVVKGYDKLDVYVDAFEKALLAYEAALQSSGVFDAYRATCSDPAEVNELETRITEYIASGKENISSIRKNLEKYRKDKNSIFTVKYVAVLQTNIGAIYIKFGEGQSMSGATYAMQTLCKSVE